MQNGIAVHRQIGYKISWHCDLAKIQFYFSSSGYLGFLTTKGTQGKQQHE
jgi:hypothetical protein